MQFQDRINKIFLIGNGFDLAHGLPTKYLDFIKWYLRGCCEKACESSRYEDDCVLVQINRGNFFNRNLDIMEEIDRSFESKEFWKFIDKKEDFDVTSNRPGKARDTSWDVKIEPKNKFSSNLLLNCHNADWSGIEDEINRIMVKEHTSLVVNRSTIMIDRRGNSKYNKALEEIKGLNKTVYQLKTKLIEYLSINNSPKECKDDLLLNESNNNWGRYITNLEGGLKREKLDRDILFLNFNYTTYFKSQVLKEFHKKFKDAFTSFETIYIHGDLKESIDNIVFGVGDENKEFYSEIESLYDNDWLVPLKSFHYFRNQKYQQLLGFIAKGSYEIYVIGHSCSTTDRTLLNMLFENEACDKIHVYHYNGIESYLATAYNIARNFNDKVRLRKVLQPFNENLTTVI